MWQKENLVDLFTQSYVPPVIIQPYEDRDEDSDSEYDSEPEEWLNEVCILCTFEGCWKKIVIFYYKFLNTMNWVYT